MKIDARLDVPLSNAGRQGQRFESLGYHGVIASEASHDPFFPLLLAAQGTQHIELITSIAVAFARTPMTLASIGHDLNSYSKGRLILGVGSQSQPNITKRFSMPWSQPVARMREFILAMRAIWDCWHHGTRLSFEGDFYTHTRMLPPFTPLDIEYGAPRVFLAAVGPSMTEVAAEVADGIVVHEFTTRKYLTEVTLPAIERGLKASGRSKDDFEIAYSGSVVTGNTQEEFDAIKQSMRARIAYFASTPSYAKVLELHGWGDLQPELHRLLALGKWHEMGALITDEILAEFAVVAEIDDVAEKLLDRWDGLVDRLNGTLPARDDEHAKELLQSLTA